VAAVASSGWIIVSEKAACFSEGKQFHQGPISVDQIVASEPPSIPVAPAVPVPIIFQNLRPQFRRLVFRGALLELITLGVYRFWLATDIRRHMWHNASVDGDALEYTGRAKELFLGALLALAIFAPLYLAYFIIGLEAERWKAFASVPFGLFFYLFAQFAVYRARRYRLSRTIWRGVRFWMTGSGWNYAFRSFGLMLLVVLTFGLALPWREAALERFKMRHSHYGGLQGRFEGTGWEFFKRGIWLWLVLAVVSFGLPVAEIALTSNHQPAFSGAVAFMVLFLGGPFIYAAFKGIQWRWWISGIRFGEVSFSSNMDSMELLDLYWKVIGWAVLIVLVLSAAIGGIVASAILLSPGGVEAGQRAAAAMQQWHVLIPVFVCYILAALLATAVMRIYLIHDLSVRVAGSTWVHNIAAAETVAAGGAPATAIGEGLADSLEMFGF
jgi:uncharacterized membrane protein YjgN (DUF898 family)